MVTHGGGLPPPQQQQMSVHIPTTTNTINSQGKKTTKQQTSKSFAKPLNNPIHLSDRIHHCPLLQTNQLTNTTNIIIFTLS